MQQLRSTQQWTTHNFQVLPSSSLSHFLLSLHLGRGCSAWIVQCQGSCCRLCLPGELWSMECPWGCRALLLVMVVLQLQWLRATPVRAAVCVCMGLGGQGSSSLYYAEPGCWTEFCGVESLPQPVTVWVSLPQLMTAEVSWEADAFPQGQGRTPENGAAQYSGSMWKIPCPRTL